MKTTKEAFKELISTWAAHRNIAGANSVEVRSLRQTFEKHYISEQRMGEVLIRAGYERVKEKFWAQHNTKS